MNQETQALRASEYLGAPDVVIKKISRTSSGVIAARDLVAPRQGKETSDGS